MTDPEAEPRLSPWAGFLLALAFLTRVSVPLPEAAVKSRLAGAAWAFPLVGVLAGAIGAAVYAAAWTIGLPPALAALLAVASQLLATGALHEDGLADTADGFGGGATAERKLLIMHDSRIGTYGVCAVVLALLLRAGALAALDLPLAAATVLVAAGALSRGTMVLLMYRLSPARAEGLGAAAGRPTRAVTIAACALSLAGAGVLTILDARLGLLALLAALGAAWLVGRLATRQIGGHTGDVLGAAQQAAEIAVLLTAVCGLSAATRYGL